MQKVRVLSYDVFRGVLLVGMVIFHVVVNLTSLQFNHEYFYWVPLGFMLFLGVVLGRFLKKRDKKKIWLSGKLLGIFILANIPNFLGKDIRFQDFLLGDINLFSFEILFPMVAVILLSIGLDRIRSFKVPLIISFFAVLALNYLDVESYNLFFLLYGLVGYFLGKGFDLDKVGDDKFFIVTCLLVILGIFGVTYYFELFEYLIVLQVLAMYFFVKFTVGKNLPLAYLGEKSLWLYVGHIVLIKGLMFL